jgi:hypothetical protein
MWGEWKSRRWEIRNFHGSEIAGVCRVRSVKSRPQVPSTIATHQSCDRERCESRGHVAASQGKSAISLRGLPAVVAMLSVAAGRSDLTAIRGDHKSLSTLLGGHSTLKAGVHPCSQSVAKFIQELLDSFKIRNEPLRLCAICRMSRIAQASDVVQPVPAIGSSSFRKLQMLQVVAQLVCFRNKEPNDCCALVRRKTAVA